MRSLTLVAPGVDVVGLGANDFLKRTNGFGWFAGSHVGGAQKELRRHVRWVDFQNRFKFVCRLAILAGKVQNHSEVRQRTWVTRQRAGQLPVNRDRFLVPFRLNQLLAALRLGREVVVLP